MQVHNKDNDWNSIFAFKLINITCSKVHEVKIDKLFLFIETKWNKWTRYSKNDLKFYIPLQEKK